MHPELRRELQSHFNSPADWPDSLSPLVASIDQAYLARDAAEEARQALESRLAGHTTQLALAQTKYQSLVERLPAVVYVRACGATGPCTYASPQLQAMLGFTAQQWMQDPTFWEKCVHPEDRPAVIEQIHLAVATGSMQSEYRMLDHAGCVVHVRDEAIVTTDAQGAWLHGVLFDVTEQHQAQDAIRESESRFRTMADTAPVLVWDADIEGAFRFFNKRWLEFTGRSLADEAGHGWTQSIHPEDRQHVVDAFQRHLRERSDFRAEYRMRRCDGQFRWVMTTGVPRYAPDTTFLGYIGTCIDIDDRKKAEQQLLHDAFYDSLTGLPNRALFTDRLERALARQKRNPKYCFAVLFMDLDRFKVVNDSLGHFVGDELLVAFARRLQQCLRPNDNLARLGGDEFTVLLDEVANPDDAVAIAERVHELLRTPFGIGQEVFTTASVGIAMSKGGYTCADDILRDADTAMYRAKAKGAGQNQFFDTEMHTLAMDLLMMENDLRRAIEREEFVVAYQPIVSLKSGRIMRFEALVRWRHPDRGLVSPADFIPVAEDTGLIVGIGRIVLNQSVRQLMLWRKQFPHLPWLGMNVNLSGRQFAQRGLVQQVQSILTEHAVSARHLGLEITESALMADPASGKVVLDSLREMGVGVYLDDFGTGYSSLGYLQQFPVDGLKIDRSFVSPATDDGRGRIAHTIINMSHDLGIPVTAEGIETVEQSRKFRGLNCELAQGYFFSKPVEALAAEKLLLNRPVFDVLPEVCINPKQPVDVVIKG